MLIPKIIHFIWAGGDDELPDSCIDKVNLWLNDNEGFEIWLWVDETSASSPNAWLRSLNCFTEAFPTKVQLKDIINLNMSNEYIRYEIEKPKPNFGASSDLLRYTILYNYGGAYFDFDIHPGSISLVENGIFEIDFNDHVLYFHKSQNTDEIGNDAFICNKNNIYIYEIFLKAIANYRLKNHPKYSNAIDKELLSLIDSNSPDALAYEAEDYFSILKSTQMKTGPLCVRTVLKNIPNEIMINLSCCNLITKSHLPLINVNSYTKPFPVSTDLWGKVKQNNLTVDKLIERIQRTIYFEYTIYKILRLDDFVAHAKVAELKRLKNVYANELEEKSMLITGLEEIAEKNSVGYIISLTNNINLKKLSCVQLTFRFTDTINFCIQNKLMEKTLLFPLVKTVSDSLTSAPYYIKALNSSMGMNKVSDLLSSFVRALMELEDVYTEIDKLIVINSRFINVALNFCRIMLEQINSEEAEALLIYIEFLESNVKDILEFFKTFEVLLLKKNLLDIRSREAEYNPRKLEFLRWENLIGRLKHKIVDSSTDRVSDRVSLTGTNDSRYRLFYQDETILEKFNMEFESDRKLPL